MEQALNSFDWPLPLRFFLALAISFLIGIERESSAANRKPVVFAGVRTYSLIGVYGFGCAWMYNHGFAWIMPIGMVSVTALIIINYLEKLRQKHVGWTSEVAALLTFLVGALSLLADIWIPMALGIVATFLLSEKAQMEKFVRRLDEAEFLAVVKFLLVTIIILPVLPDTSFTKYELNPRHIWQIVVLVSSIGFIGYFLAKKFGSRMGLWLSGIMGGIVSSTAASIACGRIAQNTPGVTYNALQASLLASSVMYIRVLIIIWILLPEMAHLFAAKLIILSLIGIGLAISVRSSDRSEENIHVNTLQNPFELKPALVFAAMFVIMSVITKMVITYYGDSGLFFLAGLTGVTDIDPFILSLIERVEQYHLIVVTAVIVAMMSNTLVKGIYFGFLAKSGRMATAWRFAAWTLLHLPIIFWPVK